MDNIPARQGHSLELPKSDVLKRLALSDSGFVFDPVSGNSFTVNGSGLAILRRPPQESGLLRIGASLSEAFAGDTHAAPRHTTPLP